MNCRIISAIASVALGISFAGAPARGGTPPSPDNPSAAAPSTRPAPKPISENTSKALAWLAKQQLENGAWGQGEESQQMGAAMGKIKDSPNVADTCMVVMAMVRAGSTPKAGEYRANVEKAVTFICSEVEESDEKSLFITSLRGTRTQGKLGTHIDTFLAAQMLAEVKDQMPSEAMTQRVEKAINKVVKKIEANQKEDGRWANEGWAPGLAQAQATKALNVVAQRGGEVDEVVRERAAEFSISQSRTSSVGGAGAGGKGDAGVELYSKGGELAAMQASASTNTEMQGKFEAILDSATTQPEAREEARRKLAFISDGNAALAKAQGEIVEKMNDDRFIAGFGSNGGEEFLSYLNIGESLFIKGGDDWAKWDRKISDSLNKVQNADGSWTGHHCITGRTFCTAAAINVLTIDRAPSPVAAKIKEAKK